MKKYCLTNEYPGICWAYDAHNPRIFYECGANYEMLDVPIKGIVKLTFKRRLDKDKIEYAIN
jgi:hypothetical protein